MLSGPFVPHGWKIHADVGHHRRIFLAASGRHDLYVVVVVVHVAAALVGFGAIALTGVYAATARHPERPGAMEETLRYFRGRALGEWALLAVPVLGVAAVAVEPGGGGLGQAWVAVALVLWAVALAAAAGVGRPARAALRAALPATADVRPADPAALAAAAGRLRWAAAVCDVVFVLAAIDMVLKP